MRRPLGVALSWMAVGCCGLGILGTMMLLLASPGVGAVLARLGSLGKLVAGARQVSAVVGTHTHVQTADEQIFPGGTAFLCDAGFTGPHESVLGREIEPIIRRFVTNTPQRFEVANGRVLLQGALIDVDDDTGRARSIQRVSEPLS